MKTCTKCKEGKSLGSFSRDAQKKDGLASHCRVCRKRHYDQTVDVILEKKMREYWGDPESARQRAKKVYEKLSEKKRAKQRKYYRDNPKKVLAHNKARAVRKTGVCAICNAEGTDRHHMDYSKPLEIVELCRSCHRSLHQSLSKVSA